MSRNWICTVCFLIVFFIFSPLMIALLVFDSCTHIPNGPETFNFNGCIYSSVHSDESKRALKPADGTTLAVGIRPSDLLSMHYKYCLYYDWCDCENKTVCLLPTYVCWRVRMCIRLLACMPVCVVFEFPPFVSLIKQKLGVFVASLHPWHGSNPSRWHTETPGCSRLSNFRQLIIKDGWFCLSIPFKYSQW